MSYKNIGQYYKIHFQSFLKYICLNFGANDLLFNIKFMMLDIVI